jgi:hypothetical protein
MVRYHMVIAITALALSAGVCEAQDDRSPCAEKPAGSSESSGLFGFNPFAPRQARELGENEGTGIDRMGTMSPGQSYDSNTGMPNVVPSDSLDEIW